MLGTCKQCGYEAGIFNISGGLCHKCINKDINDDTSTHKYQTETNKQERKETTPFSYKVIGFIFIMYAFGALLLAFGVTPGVVGFSIFLPMSLLLVITITIIIISALIKPFISRSLVIFLIAK